MIKITLDEKGVSCPSVVCDYCDDFITDAGLAWAMWKRDSKLLPEQGRTYFVHKICIDGLETREGCKMSSSELNDFLRRVIYNIKANISDNSVDGIS